MDTEQTVRITKLDMYGYAGVIGTMILFGGLSQGYITAEAFFLPEIILQINIMVYYIIRKDKPSMVITLFYLVNAIVGILKNL